MAAKAFRIAAICCAALGAILLITAMASSSWMTACLKLSNMIQGMKEIPGADDAVGNIEQAQRMLRTERSQFCIYQGLYRLSMDLAGVVHISVGIDTASLPHFVIFGGVAMAVAIVCSSAAVVALLMATAGSSDSYEHKSKLASRTRVGMILLTAAGMTSIVGMACYTSATAAMVHDPLFFAHIGRSATSSFKNIMRDPSMGRGKREVFLHNADMMAGLNKMLQGVDPTYGYAYALGWVAAAVILVGAVLSVLAKQLLILQQYNGTDNSVAL